ncbi:MAG: hypothetical protein KGL98_06615 [Gammaproteobacteria bacterium]|nr:hypothetical protein [Gammaproteobacteria bacterium]MDE2460904.1 hypothetical protein [Gammaproteobacteria bacterium]
MSKLSKPSDWETLLAQAALLQAKIPSAVLVGGTAAALHAHHRISFDHDHVLKDLSKHYDQAKAALESIAGWRTTRRVRGKLLLGNIGGIEAGLRNQRRTAPLETTSIELPNGGKLRLPTVAEMLRIKAFLVAERNATRDYLDVAALSHHLGLRKSADALERMRDLYSEFAGEGGDILITIVMKLSQPDPYDLTEVDLTEYKGIVAPWNSWRAVEKQCHALAVALLKHSPNHGITSKNSQ